MSSAAEALAGEHETYGGHWQADSLSEFILALLLPFTVHAPPV